MIRMEIALILVLAFVAYIYFSAGRRHTLLHRTFSVLLVTALVHLVFDALTVYTVARLDSVPRPVNDVLHRLFIGSMVLVVYLFYQYIAVLIEEETGKPRRLDLAAKVYLAAAELGAAASACALCRHAAGELFRRHTRQRLLCKRGLLYRRLQV